MAKLERYLDKDGKYAWRVEKQVDDVVEEVASTELPDEIEEAEAEEKPKKSRRRRK